MLESEKLHSQGLPEVPYKTSEDTGLFSFKASVDTCFGGIFQAIKPPGFSKPWRFVVTPLSLSTQKLAVLKLHQKNIVQVGKLELLESKGIIQAALIRLLIAYQKYFRAHFCHKWTIKRQPPR